ncbi:MAG: hypothetical protein IJ859_00630 [Synergistaceae bacterium]|nr:hypothetical protein [Synergistaceae bacterium]
MKFEINFAYDDFLNKPRIEWTANVIEYEVNNAAECISDIVQKVLSPKRGTDSQQEKISVDIEKIRTLLRVLIQAEYEFNTSNNLWVTDRPDLVPAEIKFETDFTKISELISEQIAEWEKLVGNHSQDCPVCEN